jgi:hypothetical protein
MIENGVVPELLVGGKRLTRLVFVLPLSLLMYDDHDEYPRASA